ncbi:MAG: nitrophenyl compound nitroreductase subunit ArsF family protein [Candidatus Omnitrophica bacterium]|nr:nitrophenyl compound nitroreductase subunit ArsF family protein [Candidatus Omnitrophota bacterium]
MKKTILVFLAVIVLSSISMVVLPCAQAGGEVKGAIVIAYYFHGTFRCPTCRKLEQYSKEAVETNFKGALSSGKLEFKVINVEDKNNGHYASEYQLYTKSLILSLVKDGKEVKWKNLDKIWEYAGNKQRFLDYVKSGIDDFLKEAQ